MPLREDLRTLSDVSYTARKKAKRLRGGAEWLRGSGNSAAAADADQAADEYEELARAARSGAARRIR